MDLYQNREIIKSFFSNKQYSFENLHREKLKSYSMPTLMQLIRYSNILLSFILPSFMLMIIMFIDIIL